MKIGLITGGGRLPDYVREAAMATDSLGLTIALDPFVPEGKFPNAERARLGQFGKIIRSLKKAECTHVCCAGLVKRPNFMRLKPDLKTIRYLPGTILAARKGDDALLRHVLGLFEKEGFTIIAPQDVYAEILLPEGVLGGVPFSDSHRGDALKACEIAAALGELDVGQGAIVARGLTLAVEAQEGTDPMLQRVLDLPQDLRGTTASPEGVLAKLVKAGQDIRVDMPVIGPETVKYAAAAGLAGIVGEAGGLFVIDRTETVRLADEAGMFIVGLPKAK